MFRAVEPDQEVYVGIGRGHVDTGVIGHVRVLVPDVKLEGAWVGAEHALDVYGVLADQAVK
jgi:hypothetical protein